MGLVPRWEGELGEQTAGSFHCRGCAWWAGLAIDVAVAGGFLLCVVGLLSPTSFWGTAWLFVPALFLCASMAIGGLIAVVIRVATSSSLSPEQKRHWYERLFVLGPWAAARYLQRRGPSG